MGRSSLVTFLFDKFVRKLFCFRILIWIFFFRSHSIWVNAIESSVLHRTIKCKFWTRNNEWSKQNKNIYYVHQWIRRRVKMLRFNALNEFFSLFHLKKKKNGFDSIRFAEAKMETKSHYYMSVRYSISTLLGKYVIEYSTLFLFVPISTTSFVFGTHQWK